MPDDPKAVGRKVLEAVREIAGTFPGGTTTSNTSGGSDNRASALSELMDAPTGLSQYIALALVAATVRWASQETGRPEDAILDELASNY